MNFEGIRSSPSEYPGGGRNVKNQAPYPEPRALTPEEVKEWNSCINEGLYKTGLPFAVAVQLFSSFRKFRGPTKTPIPTPSTPPQPPMAKYTKNAVVFIGNVFLGVFLYAPVCYKRLHDKVFANQQRIIREKEEGIIASKTEGTVPQIDQTEYQGSLNLDERESSFSSLNLDIGQSFDKPLLEDDSDKQKYRPKTTYEELRKKNREGGMSSYGSPIPAHPPPPPPSSMPPPPPPPSSSDDLGFRSFSEPILESPPVAQAPTKPKRKNKYGDDIEF